MGPVCRMMACSVPKPRSYHVIKFGHYRFSFRKPHRETFADIWLNILRPFYLKPETRTSRSTLTCMYTRMFLAPCSSQHHRSYCGAVQSMTGRLQRGSFWYQLLHHLAKSLPRNMLKPRTSLLWNQNMSSYEVPRRQCGRRCWCSGRRCWLFPPQSI